MKESRNMGVKLLWLGNIFSIAAFVIFQARWVLIFAAFFIGCVPINEGYCEGYIRGCQYGYKKGIDKSVKGCFKIRGTKNELKRTFSFR